MGKTKFLILSCCPCCHGKVEPCYLSAYDEGIGALELEILKCASLVCEANEEMKFILGEMGRNRVQV